MHYIIRNQTLNSGSLSNLLWNPHIDIIWSYPCYQTVFLGNAKSKPAAKQNAGKDPRFASSVQHLLRLSWVGLPCLEWLYWYWLRGMVSLQTNKSGFCMWSRLICAMTISTLWRSPRSLIRPDLGSSNPQPPMTQAPVICHRWGLRSWHQLWQRYGSIRFLSLIRLHHLNTNFANLWQVSSNLEWHQWPPLCKCVPLSRSTAVDPLFPSKGLCWKRQRFLVVAPHSLGRAASMLSIDNMMHGLLANVRAQRRQKAPSYSLKRLLGVRFVDFGKRHIEEIGHTVWHAAPFLELLDVTFWHFAMSICRFRFL